MSKGKRFVGGIAVLFSLGVVAGDVARADDSDFYVPMCGWSGRSDSFGRGIKDQVKGTQSDLTFELADANCYQLGKTHAVQVIAAEGGPSSSSCKDGFQAGFAQGMKASSLSAGTGCYNLGYAAGMSDLRIATAMGDVKVCGNECRQNYCQGLKDWNDGVASQSSARLNEKQQACYQHGYFNGPVVRYLCK